MINQAHEAEAELRRRKFPAVFTEILHGRTPVECGALRQARMFYLLQRSLVEKLPQCANYLPLWEMDSECVVAFDYNRNVYVQLYYEDDNDEIIADSYQQFVTWLLLELAGSVLSEERLEKVAALFEYTHLDEFVEYLEFCRTPAWDKTDTQFIASIRD